MRNPCPSRLALALLVTACAHPPRGIDVTYQAVLDGLAMTDTLRPFCLETGVMAAADDRTPLGFSATEAVEVLFGARRTADVAWFPRHSAVPERRQNLVQRIARLDIEVTLPQDASIHVVRRLSRRGKRVCPFERGYLRFPITVTISDPGGLFSLSGVERMYVSSLDPADPESWQVEWRYAEHARDGALSGAASVEFVAALADDDAGATEPTPIVGEYWGSPRGGRVRFWLAGRVFEADVLPPP